MNYRQHKYGEVKSNGEKIQVKPLLEKPNQEDLFCLPPSELQNQVEIMVYKMMNFHYIMDANFH